MLARSLCRVITAIFTHTYKKNLIVCICMYYTWMKDKWVKVVPLNFFYDKFNSRKHNIHKPKTPLHQIYINFKNLLPSPN